LWQQDSTTIAIHCKADSGTKFTVKDHGVELACNQVLIDCASTAAYTPHGFAYDVLHKSILVATYPQGQPPFHPAFYVVRANYARTFLQDTLGKDQGAFRIPLPFTNAREFPRHRQDNPMADSPLGQIVHRMWVRNHMIVPPLPDAVVGNAPI
jgi:hypothetical protein